MVRNALIGWAAAAIVLFAPDTWASAEGRETQRRTAYATLPVAPPPSHGKKSEPKTFGRREGS